MSTIVFNGNGVTIADIAAIARKDATVEVDTDVYDRLARARVASRSGSRFRPADLWT